MDATTHSFCFSLHIVSVLDDDDDDDAFVGTRSGIGIGMQII